MYVWIITLNKEFIDVFEDDKNKIIESVRITYSRTEEPKIIYDKFGILIWSNGLEAHRMLVADKATHL